MGRRSDPMVGRGDRTTNRTLMAGGPRNVMSVRITQQRWTTHSEIVQKNATFVANSYHRRRRKAGRRPEASLRFRFINAGKKGTRSRLRFGGPAYQGRRRRLRCSNLAAPRFEGLSRPQNDVLFRNSLGGGVQSSPPWELLGQVDELGNFGPELGLGAHRRTALQSHDSLAVLKFTNSGAQAPD